MMIIILLLQWEWESFGLQFAYFCTLILHIAICIGILFNLPFILLKSQFLVSKDMGYNVKCKCVMNQQTSARPEG